MNAITITEQIGVVVIAIVSIVSIFVGVAMYRNLTSVKYMDDEPEVDTSAQELKDKMKYEEELRILHSFNRKKKDDDKSV